MAKNTHAQEVATGTPDSYTSHELSDPMPTRAMIGVLIERVGEQPSAPQDGMRSTQSSESAQTSNEKPSPDPLPPVQTTENPFEQKAQETVPDSSAHSTDGNGQKTATQPSGRKAAPAKKTQPAKQQQQRSRATMMGAEDEFDEFA